VVSGTRSAPVCVCPPKGMGRDDLTVPPLSASALLVRLTAPMADMDGLRYDAARARQSLRRGRERGVWVFIPAVELRAAGIDPHAPAPTYRVWGRRSGSVLVRLYR
jgi:hypothetical protein